MRNVVSGLMALALTCGVLATAGGTAAANPIVGGGYSSSYAGESVFTNQPAGGSGQFSAIFFNDGTQAWAPGVVGLLVCLADKTTCNVASPNAAYASGWYSSTAYATVSAVIAPGQNGFFTYNFVVPAGTAPGTVATFNGDVGLIATGLMLRPEGYVQVNTTPSPTRTLTLSPTSSSLPVGATQQFTATGAPSGSLVNWSVTGGCGAISSAGVFVALAMNSAAQPCNVAATAGGLTASARITVFGSAASLACSANPTSVIANGSNTIVFSATLTDANGNTVGNATSPAITFANNTPTTGTMSGVNPQSPTGGVASVTVTTTLASGEIQVSTSAPGLTGCNAIIASSLPGAPSKTAATFLTDPIAADGVSVSIVRVELQDTAGNRVFTDSSTMVTVTRDAASANVCLIAGAGSAQASVSMGRAQFTVAATATPGSCRVSTATNSSVISASSATLTTQTVGPASRLAISSSDSPRVAGSGSLTTVTVDVQDANGKRVTSSVATVSVQLVSPGCAGAPGGDVSAASPVAFAAQGRSTFTFQSSGAYTGCALTFISTGLAGTVTTILFTPGAPDHLSCSFTPTTIRNDHGVSMATATVQVRDVNGNAVTTGSPYRITFTRTSGGSTAVLTSSPQPTVGGAASFTVRSTAAVGDDGFVASITSGSHPTLPRPTTPTACVISVQTAVP